MLCVACNHAGLQLQLVWCGQCCLWCGVWEAAAALVSVYRRCCCCCASGQAQGTTRKHMLGCALSALFVPVVTCIAHLLVLLCVVQQAESVRMPMTAFQQQCETQQCATFVSCACWVAVVAHPKCIAMKHLLAVMVCIVHSCRCLAGMPHVCRFLQGFLQAGLRPLLAGLVC